MLLSDAPVSVILFVVIGTVAHIAKKTIQYRVSNPKASAITYIAAYPYHIVYNVCISIGCVGMLQYMEQLNYATAFLSGFMSNSLLSILRASPKLGAINGSDNPEK